MLLAGNYHQPWWRCCRKKKKKSSNMGTSAQLWHHLRENCYDCLGFSSKNSLLLGPFLLSIIFSGLQDIIITFRNHRQRKRALCFKHCTASELKLLQAVYPHQSSHHFQNKQKNPSLQTWQTAFFPKLPVLQPQLLPLFPLFILTKQSYGLSWHFFGSFGHRSQTERESPMRKLLSSSWKTSIALPSDFPCTNKALSDYIPDWLQLMENSPNAKREYLPSFPTEPHLPWKTQILLRISNPGKRKRSHDI